VASRADRVHESLMGLMSQATRQWRRVLDQALEPLGLTQATWLALLHIARASGPMRQKDLAASMALDSSSIVRLLDMLQAVGYIDRLEHSDRRAKTIHLTLFGQETVAQVEEVVRSARKRLLAGIPAADLDVAHAVVTRITQTLEQTLAAGEPPSA
jgi:MarR family transcriptional regulator, transcriptional regulator for hemolysin